MSVGLINAALRMTGLGSRFLLAIFMARYMTLADIGTFALMAGAAGLLPSVAGLGLNFFLARRLVGIGHAEAVGLARERLRVSILAGACCMSILLALSNFGHLSLPISPLLAVAILMLELLGFDLQVALLARSRSTFANVLLFLRNGAWVLPFMVAAFVLPMCRSIEVLAWFWLCGLAVSHGLLALHYRRDLIAMLKTGGGVAQDGFVASVGAGAAKIYLSDLGLAGSVYLDRFIISAIEDVRSAGIYFFYASIINSAYIICLAATVQVYQPQLRAAWLSGGVAGLRDALGTRFRTTALVGLGGLIAAAPATWIAARISGKPEILEAFGLVPLLLAAYAFKLLSDFMNLAFAASERDGHYAVFNIAGLILGVAGCLLAIPLLGIIGAAVAALASALILFGLRYIAWKRMEVRALAIGRSS
ncbi:lipopolysaccharide biosynthesis protein [Aquisediminimonas profunda]|uniref:lipopolysaccharide biosynthesis protein n=1 Tax=Aquisediminimonas profunda TaxID=1550733 RepID=UPI001C632A5C|nr:hypothetical protein [Aquisediminimonas profunda]